MAGEPGDGRRTRGEPARPELGIASDASAPSVYARDRGDPHTVAQPHGPRREQGDGDEAGRPAEPAVAVRLDELRARGEEHEREHEPQRPVAEMDRELAAGEDARDGADEQPQERVRVDVARDEMPEAGDPEEAGGVEDVGADDLVRPQREDEQQRQSEEHAAADGRQPDDEAAEDPDEHGRDLVAPPHHECAVADLAHADGGLQQHPERAEQERCAEDLALRRLDAAAVPVLQPHRRRDPEERRGRASDEHPAAELRLRRPELVVAGAPHALEDRAVQDVGADRRCRVEAEDEDEDRRHERAAAHARHADEHADGEAREGELPGHSSSRSSSAATMRSAASSIPSDAMSRCTSGFSGGSYAPPAPVRLWIPPARAFAYRPFVSRSAATSGGTSTNTSRKSSSPKSARVVARSALNGETNAAMTIRPASVRIFVTSAARRLFSARSAALKPRSLLSP